MGNSSIDPRDENASEKSHVTARLELTRQGLRAFLEAEGGARLVGWVIALVLLGMVAGGIVAWARAT